MQGKKGKIRQQTLVWSRTKISRTNYEVKATVLWNKLERRDRTIPNNKPEIKVNDNKKGTCMLIDVAIPGDRNVIKKEAEKVLV
jgi:hypothetical protein